jgi:hypothetical protein
VRREHRLHQPFHAFRLVRQLGMRAAVPLVGVARELHSVDGEHLPANESVPVAHQQHLREDRRYIVHQFAHELGYRGELRRAVPGNRHEQHILPGTAARSPGSR